MREQDIRPLKYREEQERLFRLDVERMMRCSHLFESRRCPACDSEGSPPVFEKYGMSYARCVCCRTVYANPAPTEALVREYYSNSENYKFWATYIFPDTEDVRRQKIHRPRAKMLRSLCEEFDVPHETLLEVGPGFGTFCEEIRRDRYFSQVIPVEPTPELAEALRAKGFSVLDRFFEDLDSGNSADVIVAFEVIEHIREPAAFIRNCHRILRPGGILCLTAPNCDGFDTITLGEASPALDIEHLTLFNLDSLQGLMEKNGFQVIRRSTPGRLDLDIVLARLADSPSLAAANPFLSHLAATATQAAKEEFQDFLVSHCLSGNLMIVGRKAG